MRVAERADRASPIACRARRSGNMPAGRDDDAVTGGATTARAGRSKAELWPGARRIAKTTPRSAPSGESLGAARHARQRLGVVRGLLERQLPGAPTDGSAWLERKLCWARGARRLLERSSGGPALRRAAAGSGTDVRDSIWASGSPGRLPLKSLALYHRGLGRSPSRFRGSLLLLSSSGSTRGPMRPGCSDQVRARQTWRAPLAVSGTSILPCRTPRRDGDIPEPSLRCYE